jgi:hypothetical protein
MAAKSHKALNTFLFENLTHKKGILHFISTRNGGVSPKPFNSLNISFNVSDDPKHVLQNRKLLANAVGFPLESLTTSKQVHKNKVAIVTPENRGKGSSDYQSAIDNSDALITRYPDILLFVHLADCVPILLYDPVQKVIGAVHAGWRGTVLNIVQNTVNSMTKTFRSDPKNIYAGIGPSIGPCCYEVGNEVINEAPKEFIITRDGKSYFDLWDANRKQLLNTGIPSANIELAGICTMENSDQFFSSRADHGVTGRFGAGIMIV